MTPLAPRVIAITDTERGSVDVWLGQLERLLAGAAPGSVQVMLRDRQLSGQERRRFGGVLRGLTRRHGQTLSVNDRLDLAVLLDADAIHLSESSVSVSDARAFASRYQKEWWISRACHQPEDAGSCDVHGLLLSPVVDTRKGRPALSTEGLARARRALDGREPDLPRCRVYALGGVTGGNAASLVAAGADGVALIGALFEPGQARALIDGLALER